MTTTGSVANDGDSTLRRLARSRSARLATATVAAGLAVGLVASSTGSAAAATAAATDKPQAQAVGNFLDATLGGNTLDAVAKLKYATAKAPGSTSVQNPLDVELFNSLDLPLTGSLQLPSIAGINLGAATQKAQANVNGASYGQAGAVTDQGGVAVGGSDSTDKAGSATINLSASALSGSTGLPGASGLDALGSVKATISGVGAYAATPKGYGKKATTSYNIADVTLSLGSPALGGLLSTVTGAVSSILKAIPSSALGASCPLSSGAAFSQPIDLLGGGAVVLDPANGGLTISLGSLLKELGLNLNSLPANTDLIDYLLAYLADPNGLAKGLQTVINNLTSMLTADFKSCIVTPINGIPVVGSTLGGLLGTVVDGLTQGQTAVEGLVNTLVSTLSQAGSSLGGSTNPLAPLATALKQLIDIGVNVQPNGEKGTYTDPLAATPKQGTDVVEGQTVVRAIEVNVAGAAGSSLGGGSIPGLGSLPGIGSLPTSLSGFAAPKAAAAAGTGILTLALANAAAGPSTAPNKATPTPTTPDTSSAVPTTDVPTGVPAGAGDTGGSPTLPLVLVLLSLGLAAGGVGFYRFRGVHGSHH